MQRFINGKELFLLTSKLPLVNKKSEVIGVLGLYSNIAEIEEIYNESNQKKEKVAFGYNLNNFIKDNGKDLVIKNSDLLRRAQSWKGLSNQFSHITKNYLFYGLTSRQKECAYFLIRGYSYAEIADRLQIKVSTVQTHVECIKEKFKAKTRSELIESMINLGFAYI